MPSNDYHRYLKSEQRKRRMKLIILEILISALLIIPAIIFRNYLKELIPKKIIAAVKLEPGSEGFKNWRDPPITTRRSYYLFNINNPLDIVKDPKSTTINCSDTRPYTYNIKTKKTNIQWLESNTQISYDVERLFTRHSKQFKASSVNDTGIFIDLVRAIFRTQFDPKPAPSFYSLGGYNAFYYTNAVEQLEGFTSDLFTTVREKMMGPNTDKSGFIYRQNGSTLYNVSIQTDIMKKGQVLTFDSALVPFQITSPSDYPFPVYDGLTYPPMLFDKPALNIFNSDFCGPILIEYKRSVTMFQGINMHEYQVKLVDIDNCTDPNDTRTCNEVDKIDVSKCISASLPENTIFLSKPHFYGSSNETMQEMNIEGFKPRLDKHESFIYFEPYSGTPFNATLRFQVNIDAIIDPMKVSEDEPDPKPTNKKGLKRLIPIFWIDQKIRISKEVIDKFRKALRYHHFFLRYGQSIIMVPPIILSIIIIVIIEIRAKCAGRNDRYKRGEYIKSESLIQH